MSLRAVSSHRPEAGSSETPAEDREGKPATIGADSQRWQASPEQRQAHRDAIRLVSLALSATGCTQEKAARIVGVSTRQLQMKLDPEGVKRLPVSSLLQLAAAVPGFGEVVGVALATAAPTPRAGVARSPESHVMRLSAIVGDLAERTDEALADGDLSEVERRELARLHQQAIERHQRALRDLGGA